MVGRFVVVLALGLLMSPLRAQAQVNPPPQLPPKPWPAAPKMPDGTPNLGATEPNKGYWHLSQFNNYGRILKSHKEIPYQPWARALATERLADQSKWDPHGYCMPPSGPRMMTTPFPMEIIQIPQQQRILMIYEGGGHLWRIIYMDGRPHPDRDALAGSYKGHSVGRWEGDTLVVDVVGFNEGNWLDMAGNPHTDQLHVIERYTRKDLYTLAYEATIDDPGAYTEPWTIGFDIVWNEKGEIQEYICHENSVWMRKIFRDVQNSIDAQRAPRAK
jgi:hypothetical protein